MLDWLIRGAQVLDGTGADAFPADVGIKDGTIAAVGRLISIRRARVLDAARAAATPGSGHPPCPDAALFARIRKAGWLV